MRDPGTPVEHTTCRKPLDHVKGKSVRETGAVRSTASATSVAGESKNTGKSPEEN